MASSKIDRIIDLLLAHERAASMLETATPLKPMTLRNLQYAVPCTRQYASQTMNRFIAEGEYFRITVPWRAVHVNYYLSVHVPPLATYSQLLWIPRKHADIEYVLYTDATGTQELSLSSLIAHYGQKWQRQDMPF